MRARFFCVTRSFSGEGYAKFYLPRTPLPDGLSYTYTAQSIERSSVLRCFEPTLKMIATAGIADENEMLESAYQAAYNLPPFQLLEWQRSDSPLVIPSLSIESALQLMLALKERVRPVQVHDIDSTSWAREINFDFLY